MYQNASSSAPRAADPRPRYAMVYGDGQEALSDSPSDLIAILIPGYPLPGDDAGAETADAATIARVDFLTRVAAVMQDTILQESNAVGTFDPTSCGDEILTELMKDRRVPFTGISGPNGPADTEWRFSMPLFLVATDYFPYTTRVQPSGAVTLLDGSTEDLFLATVSRAGLVDVNVLAVASHPNR